MEYKITVKDETDTIELAQNFESEKFPNMIICLNGELGSGKTVFAKGFANALGVKDKSSWFERINGWIITIIFLVFSVYMAFVYLG